MNSVLINICNRRVTTGGRWEVSAALFQNIKKSALILGKKMLELGSSVGLTSHLKSCFFFLGKKISEIFLCGAFLSYVPD